MSEEGHDKISTALRSYLKGSGGIVFSNGVGSSVCVNSVEDSRQDARVRAEFSSLKRNHTSAKFIKHHRSDKLQVRRFRLLTSGRRFLLCDLKALLNIFLSE